MTVDSTVGIGSTHEPMVQRKSFPGFDLSMSHGLLAAIFRTATTATYLARMEGEEDNGWEGVATALGVS